MKKNSIYRIDYFLLFIVFLIFGIGVLAIYSAGFDTSDKLNNGMYNRQILWFIIGFVAMVAITLIDYKQLGEFSIYIYGVMAFVLILTTFAGTPIRNTRAWITIGSISIQPSEFMKLSLVFILAKFLEIRERDIKNFRELLIPTLLTIFPVLFIILQPDFGTAMIYVPILFTMLFVGGADVSHLMSIVFIAVVSLLLPIAVIYYENITILYLITLWSAFIFLTLGVFTIVLYLFSKNDKIKEFSIAFFVLAITFFASVILKIVVGGNISVITVILFLVIALTTYIIRLVTVKKFLRKLYIPAWVISIGYFASILILKYLRDYQKKRILVFLNPEMDPHASGYNVIQSKIAIGSSSFLGKGFLQGTQTQLGFLPETTSDFIFPVIVEELGFIGAFILLSLLAMLIFRGIYIALQTRDKFGALLAIGITSIFFYHILINIGMTIGIMPVTGLPLCFVSYGGSNMVMAMMGIGILINIHMKKTVN